jgi:hypothetical protein
MNRAVQHFPDRLERKDDPVIDDVAIYACWQCGHGSPKVAVQQRSTATAQTTVNQVRPLTSQRPANRPSATVAPIVRIEESNRQGVARGPKERGHNPFCATAGVPLPLSFSLVGGCWNAGSRSKGVERDQALRALAEGVDACPQCRPDTTLGILD